MTHWKINDLKGVGDVELDLDDSRRVFVFFGSNGVGKTKTLEALFFYFTVLNSEFATNVRLTNNIFSSIFCNSNNKITLDKKSISWSELSNQLSNLEEFAFNFIGANTNFNIVEPNKTIQPVGSIEDQKKSYFKLVARSFVHDTQKNLGGIAHLNDWFIARAQSVSIYQKESKSFKREIDSVLESLNRLDSRIEQSLQIDAKGNVYLKISGKERKLTELSSGFASILKIIQSIISSYALFSDETSLFEVKGVVLIDEIESHLHVEWQTKIIPTLKDLFPNTTFYIATHSPLVLSQLHEGEAYLLKRDEDGVVRSEVINSPNTRILANVLNDAFGIDLNQLKRDNMATIDQSKAKKKLLALLEDNGAGNDG